MIRPSPERPSTASASSTMPIPKSPLEAGVGPPASENVTGPAVSESSPARAESDSDSEADGDSEGDSEGDGDSDGDVEAAADGVRDGVGDDVVDDFGFGV